MIPCGEARQKGGRFARRSWPSARSTLPPLTPSSSSCRVPASACRGPRSCRRGPSRRASRCAGSTTRTRRRQMGRQIRQWRRQEEELQELRASAEAARRQRRTDLNRDIRGRFKKDGRLKCV